MRAVFIDSTAFLSMEDPDERDHQRCLKTFGDLISSRVRLITTNFVFDESYTLVMSRLGRVRAVEWGRSLRQSRVVQTLRVGSDHEARAWEIIESFVDKRFSYTDATSFAVSENLAIPAALSLDRHFRQFGTLRVLPD